MATIHDIDTMRREAVVAFVCPPYPEPAVAPAPMGKALAAIALGCLAVGAAAVAVTAFLVSPPPPPATQIPAHSAFVSPLTPAP